MLDTRGIGILQSVERLLGDIYIPALSKSSNWGDISDKQASTVRQGFMNQLENFIGKKFKAIVKASYISFSQTEGKNVRDTQLSGQSASSIECILLMDKISLFLAA